jgi:hypothetical protein
MAICCKVSYIKLHKPQPHDSVMNLECGLVKFNVTEM